MATEASPATQENLLNLHRQTLSQLNESVPLDDMQGVTLSKRCVSRGAEGGCPQLTSFQDISAFSFGDGEAADDDKAA